MQRRKLGTNGPEVSALGLGCMSMSAVYGQTPDDTESLAVLDHALALGINFWDTADVYGFHHNEKLIATALKGRRDRIVLATKFGFVRDPHSASGVGVNGTADYVRTACEGSLKRLGTDHIDLYYLHRVDPKTPIEETVGAMADLVKEGKIRFIGLSEVAPATLERACKIHPVAAVQSEYSLWTRDPEVGIIPACSRLGAGFVPYSPLGRGFLTGEIKSPDDFDATDWRRGNPRFQGEQFAANLRLVDHIKELAAAKGVSASQLALAWVMAQGETIVPIPGTRRKKYLDDNAGAARVTLTPDELAAIDKAFPRNLDVGPRYTEGGMAAVNG